MMAHTLSLIITRGSVDFKSYRNVVPIIENEPKFTTVQSVDSVEVNSAVFVLLESFQVCRITQIRASLHHVSMCYCACITKKLN